ncbi:MAG: SPASM domain-containing protein, partial [Luteolibacter sp.]
KDPDLTTMLRTSPARQEFVERPKHLVEHEDCLECRYLSICHGGCPVRTYSALGTMLAKDPYCEVYKTIFARAETHGRAVIRDEILHRKLWNTPLSTAGSMTTVAMSTRALIEEDE